MMGFVMEFGPRNPGLVNWLKYREHSGYASTRPWLFCWRMFWSTHELSEQIGEPMTRWACLKYAIRQTKQICYGG